MSKKANRLSTSLSPYLLQHKYNPVDWYPWGDEALERAREEEKPIFLSIGYSACHWCHVMEQESFEDEKVAKLLNANFINIKVDREERPDLDRLYMSFVQAMTGHGGWPMSLFLTPDLKPFYAGTYFPPSPRYGMPSFTSLLLQIIAAWEQHRKELIESSEKVFVFLQKEQQEQMPKSSLSEKLLELLAAQCLTIYDPIYGGFGGAPKFPQTGTLFALLRFHNHNPSREISEILIHTLQQMARGGIYDQLGGGFHRYTVDEKWLVPHFEKMLYDNALLSRLYLEVYQVTKEKEFLDIALNTLRYLLNEMRHSLGGFYSAEDADSEGEEGKFYLWSYDEIQKNLQNPSLFCKVYGVTQEGNFEGANILHQQIPLQSLNLQEREQLETDRKILLNLRSGRPRPHLDDKILADWNGLVITSLAKAYQITGEKLYLTAAQQTASFIKNHMMSEGRLYHLWRGTMGAAEGFLEDYANYSNALIDLYECDFNQDHLKTAKEILDTMEELFWDPDQGGYYSSSKAHPYLILRKKSYRDEATPSGNAQAAISLMRLSSYFEMPKYQAMAERILTSRAKEMQSSPHGYGTLISAADCYLSSMQQIVLTGTAADDGRFVKLLETIYDAFLPNRVLAVSKPEDNQTLPLCEGKRSKEAQVFICYKGFCSPPTSDPKQLQALLRIH